jgi:hypothetical protein
MLVADDPHIAIVVLRRMLAVADNDYICFDGGSGSKVNLDCLIREFIR